MLLYKALKYIFTLINSGDMKTIGYKRYRSMFNNKLNTFQKELARKGFKISTIEQHLNYVSEFLYFIGEKLINIKDCSYSDLLMYIEHHKAISSLNNINRKLTSIRYYYKFIDEDNNPAKDITIRGKRNKLLRGIISIEELNKIYNEYIVKDIRTKRNKAILSLIIKQGIRSSELSTLKIKDIDLINGTISLPNRSLSLESCQILEIYEYITIYRKKIVRSSITKQLFISMNGKLTIKSSLEHLFKFLRKKTPKLKSSSQLRHSLISYWLKTYNIRKVQYLAGHRCISTTERYKESSLEDIRLGLDSFTMFR